MGQTGAKGQDERNRQRTRDDRPTIEGKRQELRVHDTCKSENEAIEGEEEHLKVLVEENPENPDEEEETNAYANDSDNDDLIHFAFGGEDLEVGLRDGDDNPKDKRHQADENQLLMFNEVAADKGANREDRAFRTEGKEEQTKADRKGGYQEGHIGLN